MISVAMTTYNGERYVEKQIKSILVQTMPADEIIICDDGSSDSTVPIIQRIMESASGRKIRLIVNERNLGYTRNFYQATSLAKGEYIFFADQDDIWHTDKIQRSVAVMQELDCAAICTNFKLIDRNGTEITNREAYRISKFVINADGEVVPISFHKLVFGNLVQGCTYCFTKEVRDLFLQINYDYVIHDYQVMLIAALVGRVYFLNEALIDYRLHGNNSVGFAKKGENGDVILKKPQRKPSMVRYFERLNQVIKVPHLWYYNMLYYLRIPHFVSMFKKWRE